MLARLARLMHLYGKFSPGVPGNLAPPNFGPPGPNFLGNLASPGAIFPRKFGPPFGNLAPLYNES